MYSSVRPRSALGYAATSPSPLRHASRVSSNSSDYSDRSPPSRGSTVSSKDSYGAHEEATLRSLTPTHDYTKRFPPPDTAVGTVEEDTRAANIQNRTQTESPRYHEMPHPAPVESLPMRDSVSKVADGLSRLSHRDSSTCREGEGVPRSLRLKSPETSPTRTVPSTHSLGTMTRADSVRRTRHATDRMRTGHGSATSIQTDKQDLCTFQKSSTGHLRTLSELARKDNAIENELGINSPEQEVAGLHGRKRFQRADAQQARSSGTGVGYAGRTWIDTQRQYLQAYEYLCHIGEAKEWIEDIIEKSIPPIIQLEEALRDGVTLAEVVQALNSDHNYRIFRHDRLQFRHSDNIAIFFNYVAEIELPELFRFELVDLYEKKNIPKVIYCIHALSWLLFRKGIVDFRIGNLVGQLQFEDHELQAMQHGLERSGIPMPNFGAMSAAMSGVAEEPKESESDRRERLRREQEETEQRELLAHAASVTDLQSQIRGALRRLDLGDHMQNLWEHEHFITDLQSRIRADFSRQVFAYKIEMRRFAIALQSLARGCVSRRRMSEVQLYYRNVEPAVTLAQRIWRGRKSRLKTQRFATEVRAHEQGVRQFQAAIRGWAERQQVASEQRAIESTVPQTRFLQSAIRAALARRQVERQYIDLEENANVIEQLQTHIRAALQRRRYKAVQAALLAEEKTTTGLQCASRALLLRRRINATQNGLVSSTSSTIALQSAIHGYLHRQATFALLCELEDQTEGIIALQSICRAVLLRRDVTELLNVLDGHVQIVIALQAQIRGLSVRRRFKEKMDFYQRNMRNVVKIQSFVRAKQQGEAYKTLTSGKNPPVGIVKNFVHLLNDSDFDFDEEIEFERLRKSAVQHVRQNELAEQYIDQLDIKIALLVKNKITLDEVIKHQKHFGGHVGNLLTNRDISSKDPFDLKALNKNSRRKLEYYQELFFLLQTQPLYLARLFQRIREQSMSDKESNRAEMLIMTLFGFAQKSREEYYLLKVVSRAIKAEAAASVDLQQYLRANFFWTKIFGRYIRSPRDRKYLRDLFGPIIKENIVEHDDLDLESDPVQIYRSLINNEELRTGQRSRRDPNTSREQAIRDPDTRDTFVQHLSDLRDIGDHFLICLAEIIHKLPYGVRYIAHQTFHALHRQFPGEGEQSILKLVGNWVWKSYLNPALLSPETWGVVDRGLSPLHKRNLGEVSKLLGQVCLGRPFGNDNVYLKPLDNWINDAVLRIEDIWANMIDIQGIEAQFDIDEFNDLYSRTKPTLYIKLADIFALHKLVAEETGSLCSAKDDPLMEVVRELGSAKTNEHELSAVGSSEISLQLNTKYHNMEDPDAAIKALFMETKRCVLYIIRVQTGINLLDIMIKPVNESDEDRWGQLVREEVVTQRTSPKKRTAYATDAPHALMDLTTISYKELKRTALENILALQKTGRISPHNHYQDLLNAIAVDIRTKHRRRQQRAKELDSVRATLSNLDEKAVWLDQKLKSYNDYIEQAMITLQNKKGKKKFLMPFTRQYNHERELQRAGRVPKFGSYKYSARNLADKGVLVSWKGYGERQWDRINVTISSDEVGLFHIEGSIGSMMIPGASATVPLDDLLQAQFNNCQFINLFGEETTEGAGGGGSSSREGALGLNVNLLVHLLMRKFYRDE